MKIKIIIVTALIICSTSLEAWYGRIFLFGDDNGVWKVLLRLDPNTNQWTDFKKSPMQPKQGGNNLASQALREQIRGNFYQLTPEDIARYAKYSKDNDDVVHFARVDFIPGQILHNKARIREVSNDFVWIPLSELLSSQSLTRPHRVGQQQQVINYTVDPDILRIIKENISTIRSLLKRVQPQAEEPQAFPTAEGKWDIPNAIFFYNRGKKYFEFTNFYERPVIIDGKKWPTTEHYYQAQKFTDENLQEKIRNSSFTAREAFNFAGKHSNAVRNDWKVENLNLTIMLKAVRAKFNQYEDLKNLLLNTGDKILVEDAGANDEFFGAGADYNGDNHLGQILMQVREELNGAPLHQTYISHPVSYYMQKESPSIPPQNIPSEPLQEPTIATDIDDLINSLAALTKSLIYLANILNPSQQQTCITC